LNPGEKPTGDFEGDVGSHGTGVTPDPIPNSLVKPGYADDPQRVHRLEACATINLIAASPLLDRGGLFLLNLQILPGVIKMASRF
jgi:hypothetical protein